MGRTRSIRNGGIKRAVPIGIGAIVLAVLFLWHPDAALAAGLEALTIWFQNVFPALMPFFVLIAILTKSGLPAVTAPAFAPLLRLFRLPGDCAIAILLGSLSGYPAGAVLAGDLLERGAIDNRGCERLLLLCNMPGPMFVLGSVATGMLQRSALGVPILVSQYIAALIVALIGTALVPQTPISPKHPDRQPSTSQPPSLASTLTESIGDGVSAMLRVAGFMVFASVLFGTIQATGAFRPIAGALSRFWPEGVTNAVLTGLFEMSYGCAALGKLALPMPVVAGLCAFVLGLGGLSVLLQSVHFAPVRFGVLLAYKAAQGAIAGVITWAWTQSLHLSAPVFAFAPAAAPERQSTASLLICGVVLLACLIGKRLMRSNRERSRSVRSPLP